MKQPIEALMTQGTIGALFLAVLLIALVAFVGWSKKLISDQMKIKDERISDLEEDVKQLQAFYNTELMKMLGDMQRTVQKNTDTFDRMENILLQFKKSI